MRRGLPVLTLSLVIGFAFVGSALAQSGSVDEQHEAIMALIMKGNDANAEGAASADSDPKAACLAYRRAVSLYGQAMADTKRLKARLKPNDPSQAELIEHMSLMTDDTGAALITAQTGVKTYCR